MAIATYSFLPWVRQGLSNSIREGEIEPNPTLRPSIMVEVQLAADHGAATPVSRQVHLYGPGDVLAIDRGAIVHCEPPDWTTNFEPNYLAHVDFYDEDFPWRYTPAHPDTVTHRQRPWIALIVLAEGEFDESPTADKPTPSIVLKDLSSLPPANELWAWAHVHVDRALYPDEVVATSRSAVEAALKSARDENPDLAHARLLCPRKLAANRGYHAFVVPTFESGRVAGLGLDLSRVDQSMRGAWEDHPQRAALSPQEMPYYHRWYFRTGNEGDFEQLVRLLKPKPMDARVGQRDLDVARSAPNLPGIAGPRADGVLRLGGLLRVPRQTLTPAQRQEADDFDAWDQPRPAPFQRALAAYLNLTDAYQGASPAEAHRDTRLPALITRLPDGSRDPDPIVTPPLYGRWHGLTSRLLDQRDGSPVAAPDNWLHQLNLDPRHRVAAGLGTKVIRDRQEAYIKAAWEQIGQVLEANRQIRAAQASVAVSMTWYTRTLEQLGAASPARLLTFAGPVATRVVAGGRTVRKQISDSTIPRTMLTASLRRALRPTGRVVRKMADSVAAGRALTNELVSALNEGHAKSAQVPALPGGAATIEELRKRVASRLPPPLDRYFERLPGPLLPRSESSRWVEKMPPVGNLGVLPFGVIPDQTPPGPDDEISVRFKKAMSAEFDRRHDAAEGTSPARVQLELSDVAGGILRALDPNSTIRARLDSLVLLPARIRAQMREDFGEVTAYPRIDEPMYKPLAALGSELFLPNMNLIPQNCLSLLESNPAFIESYMMGLNHEFARELLWREYPTDQRGSYMRQCFDVGDYASDDGLTPDARREQNYDVRKLHTWSRNQPLGQHGNGGSSQAQLVLVIRGELLKRYPNAVIYAHRAAWQETHGRIDKSLSRVPVMLTEAQELTPPRDLLKTPVYTAKIEPDVSFLGFDLEAKVAKGDPATDDPGWFFVLKERPGEPRFGLDVERAADAMLLTWSDLSWKDVSLQNGLLRPGNPAVALVAPGVDTPPERAQQHADDVRVRWNGATTSAEVAYVLNQLPVLVAVHASEMLP